MSSGGLARNRSSSPRVGVGIRTSGSQEIPDSAQISLPPSEPGLSRGTEVRSRVFCSNTAITETKTLTQNVNPTQIPPLPSEAGSVQEDEPVTMSGTAPTPPELADDVDEDQRARWFLREVAWGDPYIKRPDQTNEADDKKRAESLEKLLTEVTKHDEGMVKGWRDDIDTLLVFAGLFSAVVTAFVIESYQWLDEDPADTTVTLLTQLLLVQVNGSQPVSFEPAQFKPDALSIRINVFWFLSLIFSLTSALFGLLCKQWVREHERDTTTRTAAEALALRQLRRDSFEKWGVSSFLSALPILLEAALLFFFVGVLDLLWDRHPVPFAVCFVAISFSAGLYFLTALLPSLMVPRNQKLVISRRRFDRLSYQFICPYKSPQAWLVYQLSSALLRPLLKIRVIDKYLREKAERFWYHIKWPAPDWSSFDLWVVRQFDQKTRFPSSFSLKVYELRAFEWAVTMFRDSPSMIPHLENILETIPPSVAVSAVLDRWDMTMWETISMHDVEDALRDPEPYPWIPTPTIRPPVLQHPEGINLLFHHRHWATIAADFPHDLDEFSNATKYTSLQHSTGLRFVIPFPVVDALWTHEDTYVRAKSLKLLSLFEQSWKPCPEYDGGRHEGERVAFVLALANHINRTDRVSVLLTSKRGQAFIRFIHNEVVARRWVLDEMPWSQAIRRAREVGDLPSDYFAPVPGYGHSLPALPILDPVRYSIETKMGDASGAGPTEGGLVRRLHNFGTWLAFRRWLSFFQRNEQVIHNNVGSSGNTVPNHELGVDGAGQSTGNQEECAMGHHADEDDTRRLGKGDSIKESGAGKRTGILDDPSKGDEGWNVADQPLGIISAWGDGIDLVSPQRSGRGGLFAKGLF
ncbi:hypothetical protein Moror_12082 [Moniliophthora roreri MCA 2997]|uniref:DUF6535 domain-containing protein n=1 Tax=Moniliophthora roreri (strain MCA 2997) TaxID=1381753 RepID=V2XW05_MONRO|nr:hypothetical protein Moror_12082 [Moniliophthora roreri MCA 2997]